MSVEAFVWALHDSPVKDTTERLILAGLADKANADGTDAFPSKKSLARVALCHPDVVKRKLGELRRRGVIKLGDQAAARYLPAHVRPQVYDLMIPARWYGPDRLERVNRERADKGLPPLTEESRPPLAEAPTRTPRSDKGKKRSAAPVEMPVETGETRGGDSQSPGGGTLSPRGGGLSVPGGGDSQSPNPSFNPPSNTAPFRPSVEPEGADAQARADDGRTDGQGSADGGQEQRQEPGGGRAAAPVARTPGVELLLRIGATETDPRYAAALTGGVLADQGRMVTGMLAEGWTQTQVRRALTGQPLPPQEEITRSVGAILAKRLRDAAAAGPPLAAPAAPATPTPPAFGEHLPAEDAFAEDDGQEPEAARAAVPSQGGPAAADDGALEDQDQEPGLCPGHDGVPCGRRAGHGLLCGQCTVAARPRTAQPTRRRRRTTATTRTTTRTTGTEGAHHG